jgi:hypothetical protein
MRTSIHLIGVVIYGVLLSGCSEKKDEVDHAALTRKQLERFGGKSDASTGLEGTYFAEQGGSPFGKDFVAVESGGKIRWGNLTQENGSNYRLQGSALQVNMGQPESMTWKNNKTEVVIKDNWVTRFSVKDGVLTSTENGQRFVKAAQ